MKKWINKKSLRATVDKLTTENRMLHQRVAAHRASTTQWERVADDYKCDLDAAYKYIEILRCRLNKRDDRKRGTGVGMGPTLNELGRRAYENAKAKGFHETPSPIPTRLMLIVSELSEAMEADRFNRHTPDLRKYWPIPMETRLHIMDFEAVVKDTFEDELADALIRIVGLAASMGIDLDAHVQMKMMYNATREYKHGKKY